MTCGGCYHYRWGRCKNKRASTYGVPYPSDSVGCQLHVTKLLRPFGLLVNIIVFLVLIVFSIPLAIWSGFGTSSNSSSSGGFKI